MPTSSQTCLAIIVQVPVQECQQMRDCVYPYLNIPFKMSAEVLARGLFWVSHKACLSKPQCRSNPYSLITLARANVSPSHRMGSSNSHEGEERKFTAAPIY